MAKRFKVDLEDHNEKSTPTISSTRTILILNNDCLEEVFSNLSQNDLLNVYAANLRLRFACERTFARKFGKVPVLVTNLHSNRLNIHQLKNSIKMLEAFGHLVTKLRVNIKLEKVEGLLEAIGNNCGDNINELEFCHLGVRVKEPYPNLYTTGLQQMISFLRRLNERFPNLTSLKFDYRNLSKYCPYFDSIVRPIPSLRSFSVVGPLVCSATVQTFVDLNRQLESFTMIGEPYAFSETVRSLYITEDFIDYLDESLPQLKSLEINGVSIKEMPPLSLEHHPNRFANLKKLAFGCFSTTFSPERGFMSCLGEGIEELELFTFNYGLNNFSKSISRFKTLKRLVLHLTKMMHLKMEWLLMFQPQVVSIWSLHGMRELMLQHGQLTEIVIHRYGKDENYDSSGHEVKTWNRKALMA